MTKKYKSRKTSKPFIVRLNDNARIAESIADALIEALAEKHRLLAMKGESDD